MNRVLAALGGAGAILALLAFGASPASAASCERGLLGGGPTSWEADAADAEFDDASLFTDVGLDAFRDDAFDAYGIVQIDGLDYVNPDETGCSYSKRKDEVRFPADIVNGIAVKPQLYASKRKPLGRLFVSLRNTTGGPLTIEFAWDGNVGAGDPVVGATSNGDQTMDQEDRWGTSCDDDDLDGCGDVAGEANRDPELAYNWEGRGPKTHGADLVSDPELTDDDVRFQFDDVTIGASKTVTFLQVVTLAPKIRAANKAARAIDRNPARAGAFAGLSKRERRRLQNW